MTRGDWYAQRYGGGWRTARKQHRCDQADAHGLRCVGVTLAGSPYFDTNAPNPRSRNRFAKLKLCAACATEELK